ncbi:hypothetical protein [Bradyrhizobium sp. AZCC 2230]|uniref:hypothetical protein n=1 Tax=Bradyrhizobium sp. AZCC 2230 TaxID=3117021 RepID=UPI002FF116BA
MIAVRLPVDEILQIVLAGASRRRVQAIRVGDAFYHALLNFAALVCNVGSADSRHKDRNAKPVIALSMVHGLARRVVR